LSRAARWSWIAPILVYAAAALEMIIMISPFAAYYYSVYTPLFHGLQGNAATAWLPQFFLPHLAQAGLFFRLLSYLGLVLAAAGLIGFIVCALQLYYGKFIRKRLVSGGLYGRVRHPQYLCLAVAGAGLLLLWPRFFILASYLIMLGLYYVLARHEEETIRRRYGHVTEQYLARVPMFNPFRRPAASQPWQPLSRGRAVTIWLSVVVVSLALAFGLRTLAVDQLSVVRSPSLNVTALSLRARPASDIDGLMQAVLATEPLRTLMHSGADQVLFMQIASGGPQFRHLLIDLGMRSDAVEKTRDLHDGELIVISRVVASDPDPLALPDPFAIGTRIEPLFLGAAPGTAGPVAVRALSSEQFYPDFARIRF
jgi:protein-S-isoprenylcysteine O-methyltransferase Ste14